MIPMSLLDWTTDSPHRRVVPLAGFPGIQLTGSSIKQNEMNAEIQARSLYKLAERTRPDMIFTMMDLSVEAGALGLPVRMPLMESATIEDHPVKTIGDLARFRNVDILSDGRVWVFRETVRRLKRSLNIPVGAYTIGPFSLAGLLIGASEIAMATLENPELVRATVDFCETVVLRYATALLEAGSDAVCVLEPTAVLLSPRSFHTFAEPNLKTLFEGLNTRTILHICGDSTHLIPNMCNTGAQALSLDADVDLPAVSKTIPNDIIIMGNIHPVLTMLNKNRDEVRHDVNSLLNAMRPFNNFILSTGCDLPADTPIDNISEMVSAAKNDAVS